MASILRLDTLESVADTHIEAAVTAMRAAFGPGDVDRVTRDDCLRVLTRRVVRKHKRNKTYGAL